MKFYKLITKNKTELVRIDYKTLFDKSADTKKVIGAAFDKSSLGAIVVRNVPNLKETRSNFYKVLSQLAPNVDKYDHLIKPETMYLAGLENAGSILDGKRTNLSSSYNFCASFDTCDFPDYPHLEKSFKNQWPEDITDYGKHSLAMGRLMTSIVLETLRNIDNYLGGLFVSDPNYSLYQKIAKNNNYFDQNRSIIYHPVEEKDKKNQDYVSFHRDNTILSALIHPSYYDTNMKQLDHGKSGLKVITKNEEVVDVEYYDDEVLVQVGDCGYYLTAGQILPTPHGVIIDKTIPSNSYRLTHACFMGAAFKNPIKIPGNKKLDDLVENFPLGKKYMVHNGIFYDGITYGELTLKFHKAFFGLDNQQFP